jgi:HEAT repeat protein
VTRGSRPRHTLAPWAGASLFVALVACGCRPWTGQGLLQPPKELPSGQKPAGAKSDEPTTAPALTQDVWIRTLDRPGMPADAPRWHNPAMDELLAAPVARQPDFYAALDDERPIVATNAAIALSRQGQGAGSERLAEAVRATSFKLPLRRAAAEALARLSEPSTAQLLGELLDQYGKFSADAAAAYVPELHAELLYGLARHVGPHEDPRFAAAAQSPAPEVRLAALAAFAGDTAGNVPTAVADLRGDPNERVRIAALAALVKREHPRALEYVEAALTDQTLEVRLAAIDCLGKVGGSEATRLLAGLLEHDSELTRAAAVSALAEMGDQQRVRSAARDKSWRVRRVVAEKLAVAPDQESLALARQFLADRVAEVQRQMVASLDNWPFERAGPLLLTAIEHSSYLSRKAAVEQLRRRWPPAADFSVDVPADRRAEALAALRKAWDAEYPPSQQLATASQPPDKSSAAPVDAPHVNQLVDQLEEAGANASERDAAVRELKALGPAVLAVFEQRALEGGRPLSAPIFRDVLPALGEAYAAADALSSPDVQQRRRAADRLVKQAADGPLPLLVRQRMAELGMVEGDALVCRSLLRALATDESEPATRLAYALASHRSADIRELACAYLECHPSPGHTPILLPALSDSYTPVARAAARALGHPGMLADPAPLERLLNSPDKSVRLEVATALARLKVASGPPALERLAHDPDPDIRRRTAIVMGELGDPVFTSTLIGLLDDGLAARPAALESLPRVVGRDIVADAGESAATLVDKIECWKRWWQREHIHADR